MFMVNAKKVILTTEPQRHREKILYPTQVPQCLRVSVVIFLLFTIFACSEKPKQAAKGGEKSGVLISTAKAETRKLERAATFVGEFQAEEEANVKAEVKGRVEAVYKNLGDDVKKGELIARIDSEEYRIAQEQAAQALKEAKSRYDLAVLNWERADNLFKKGLISQRERDEAREALKGLDATVKERHSGYEMAAKRLRDTSIIAPFAGVIKERFVSIGDYVDDKTTVASVVALSPIKLRVTVPEKVAGVVRKNISVSASVEAYPGRLFKGIVNRISPALDAKTRSLTVEATFQNKDGLLKPGFFAEGRVVIKAADKAVFVPEEAVASFAGVRKVYLIADGKASERVVKTGEKLENMVEIAEGVKEGEVVATSSLSKLSTGVKVEVKK